MTLGLYRLPKGLRNGCCNSEVIDAPVEKVWAGIRDFHDLSWAPNVIESLEAGGSSGIAVGATRVLNGVFKETLLALDDDARSIRYSIDDGPNAVSKDNVQGYIGEVGVFPSTSSNGTFVLWTSSWSGGGEGARAFCDPIYQALLGDMKASLSS